MYMTCCWMYMYEDASRPNNIEKWTLGLAWLTNNVDLTKVYLTSVFLILVSRACDLLGVSIRNGNGFGDPSTLMSELVDMVLRSSIRRTSTRTRTRNSLFDIIAQKTCTVIMQYKYTVLIVGRSLHWLQVRTALVRTTRGITRKNNIAILTTRYHKI